MQSFTLASAIVASVAYGTAFDLKLTTTSDDTLWATTDINVDWKVAESAEKTIQLEISGEFSLSAEAGRLDAAQANRVQWFFCWDDTNECWATKNSDETEEGQFYLQNYIVFSEGKRTHSGNTWPGEYGADDEWWVYYGSKESSWTEDIANPIYNADFERNQFTESGWTTQSYRLWNHCESYYDEMIYGMTRQATIGLYAEVSGYDAKFTSKQVTVDFEPATAEQRAALQYIEPSDPAFKQDCADQTVSDEFTALIAQLEEEEAQANQEDAATEDVVDDVTTDDVVDDVAEDVNDTPQDDVDGEATEVVADDDVADDDVADDDVADDDVADDDVADDDVADDVADDDVADDDDTVIAEDIDDVLDDVVVDEEGEEEHDGDHDEPTEAIAQPQYDDEDDDQYVTFGSEFVNEVTFSSDKDPDYWREVSFSSEKTPEEWRDEHNEANRNTGEVTFSSENEPVEMGKGTMSFSSTKSPEEWEAEKPDRVKGQVTFSSENDPTPFDKGDVTFDSSVRHYSKERPEFNVKSVRISMYVGFLIIFTVLLIACTLAVCTNRYQSRNRVEQGAAAKTLSVEMNDNIADPESQQVDDSIGRLPAEGSGARKTLLINANSPVTPNDSQVQQSMDEAQNLRTQQAETRILSAYSRGQRTTQQDVSERQDEVSAQNQNGDSAWAKDSMEKGEQHRETMAPVQSEQLPSIGGLPGIDTHKLDMGAGMQLYEPKIDKSASQGSIMGENSNAVQNHSTNRP